MTPATAPDVLIIAHAAAEDDACRAAIRPLHLPHLTQLVNTWQRQPVQSGDAYQLNTPHERAVAAAMGWAARADGLIPMAAWHARLTARPCAWFHLCQWNVGMEQVSLQPLSQTDLTADESRALLEALGPLATEDGITLVYEQPNRWRAEAEVFRHVPWASLDRVAGRRLNGWLPDAREQPAARGLLRLQNEAQMLFYTHPVNDARAVRGLAPVNGFWISGGGVLDDGEALSPPPMLDTRLGPPALRGDWGAWAQAWTALDAEVIGPWMQSSERRGVPTLVLCGERSSQAFTAAPPTPSKGETPPWWRRWWPARTVSLTASDILESL